MRNTLILILISIFLVGCQTTSRVKEEPKEGGEMEGIESSSVELSIQAEKESYSVGEPIKLLVSLKNISEESIIIYTFDQDAYIGMFLLEFYITTHTKYDAKHPSIPTGRPFGVIKTFPGRVMTISPNESWKATVDLRSWITDSFDNTRIVGEPWGGKILDLKKGLYEIQAIWNTSPLADTVDLKNFTQFKENPVSNTIVIKVASEKEPKETEEIE